jgi:murein DD-endopeptidase MepM/ murein hydrolase activator NlpD
MFWKLPQELLIDPQQMNSYSYARNNPVNMKDPSGNQAQTVKKQIQSYFNSIKSWYNKSFSTGQSQAQTSQMKGPLSLENIQKSQIGNNMLNSPVGNAPITSLFKSDRSDCAICSKTHGGTDYAVPTGTPVYATAPGKVVESREMIGYGNTVILNHGPSVVKTQDDIYTLYAHGSSLQVNQGQNVKTNDLLMYSGNTGNSTGPHVHYEVISSPTYPENFFKNLNIRYGPDDLKSFIIKP